MSEKLPPIIFPVIAVPHVHDGDTLWVQRRWQVGDDGTGQLWKQDYDGGVPVRLTDGVRGLDTPELSTGLPGANARTDLEFIVEQHEIVPLEFVWWRKKSFDRMVGDVRPVGTIYGFTAMMLARGWDTWKP